MVSGEPVLTQAVCTLWQEQALSYDCFAPEACQSLPVQAEQSAFLVLLPSFYDLAKLNLYRAWIAQAQQQRIPVLLLSSLAIFPKRTEGLWQEAHSERADTALAQQLMQLEQGVAQGEQYLIVRVGQGMTLQGQDFPALLLAALKQESLKLSAQELFSPTPVPDVAEVLLAMLRQANLQNNLWGTYHFNGVEPVSALKFAEAFLVEVQHHQPHKVGVEAAEQGMQPQLTVPSGDCTKLFHTFGIKSKPWRKRLPAVVQQHFTQP
ncbi:MAG: hypothetical protein RL217_796 [Pseudomonadota bacterium]